jgi:hypothetical protein
MGNWKDNLLSSGLPLEYSVRKSLEDLGIWGAREYKYERINEAGIPVLFSIDTHATKSYYGPGDLGGPYHVYLELFIECKYRHDSVQWFFTPDEFDSDVLAAQYTDIFIILDQLTRTYKLDGSNLDSFARSYDLCRKGIELTGNGRNSKSIRQSIEQLRFAIADQVAEAFEHQVYPLLGQVEPLFILVPIVVTTAELWRINSGVTVGDIRAADVVEDVAQQKDVLILHKRPDNELSKHTKKRIMEVFDSDERPNIGSQLLSNQWSEFLSGHRNSYPGGDSETEFEGFVNAFAARYPCLFLVVHYSKFRDIVERLLSFFEESSRVVNLTSESTIPAPSVPVSRGRKDESESGDEEDLPF